MDGFQVQGRWLRSEDVDWIQELIGSNPGWGRFQLSVHIAQAWNWRNGAGQLKDMAARTLLLKLERRGLLKLPRRQRGGGSRRAQAPGSEQLGLWSQPRIEGPLQDFLPLKLEPVTTPQERTLLTQQLQQYHYLGYRRPVGENMQYLVWDKSRRLLACLVFGAAAWGCAPRDQFIGWNQPTRQRHLHLLANNMRFLMLPWVRVGHLASHLLARVAARLSQDWQGKYGHGIYLLESFVERARFRGSCYRAANWIGLGPTQGRSRNDRNNCLQVPCKEVYVYPLRPDWRRVLHGEPQPLPHHE